MVGWRHAATTLALVGALAGAQGAQAAAPVLVIDGAGDGHGVGMSQTGAAGLALHGYSARAILAHYYTGTIVGRLASEHSISVLLQSRLRSVVFSGATRAGVRRLIGDRTYIATSAGTGRSRWRAITGRLLSYLPAPLLIASAIPIRFDGAASTGVINGRYRGSLDLVLRGSRLDVINHLGLEAYLRGVVPAESPSNWPAAELRGAGDRRPHLRRREPAAAGLRRLRRHPLAGVRRRRRRDALDRRRRRGDHRRGRDLRRAAGRDLLLRELGRGDRGRRRTSSPAWRPSPT